VGDYEIALLSSVLYSLMSISLTYEGLLNHYVLT